MVSKLHLLLWPSGWNGAFPEAGGGICQPCVLPVFSVRLGTAGSGISLPAAFYGRKNALP